MEMENMIEEDGINSADDSSIAESESEILHHFPLHQCARDGDSSNIKFLLKYMIGKNTLEKNINKHDESDLSPLHYAVRYGHIDSVKLLVEHGADINNPGAYGAHPLHLAAKYKPENIKKTVNANENEEGGGEEEEAEGNEESQAEPSQKSVVKYLVESGADINCQDTYGSTPLHYASMRGCDSVIRDLLCFQHIEVDKVDKTMMTALHTAARYSQIVVAEELLNAGAQVQCLDDERCTPLFYACFYGCEKLVMLLLDKAIERNGWLGASDLLSNKNIDGQTCLHAAVNGGNINIVKACLQRNADVNAVQNDKSMPLHLAAMSGSMDCVKMLIDHNARIDAFDHEQSTPLHKACLYNHHEVAKYLIKRGARINKRDYDSCTPLLLASLKGHVETIEVLLEAFADYTAVDISEKTAVYLAVEENHLEALKKLLEYPIVTDQIYESDQYGNIPLHIAAKEGYLEIVRLLLQYGASINAANDEESSPIHLAAQYGRTNVVRLLVQKENSIVKSEDEDSNTPLHIAALYGHDMVGKILLEYGADVCAKNNKLWTPLDCAAAKGMTSIAQVLLDNDSPVDPADKTKMTPLHLAAQGGHSRMVTLLLDHNANIGQCDSDGNNCLDLAIDNNHSDIAMLLINHEKWEDVMRNETMDLLHYCRQTPMRKLIQKMPEVAGRVLNRCVTSTGDSNSKERCITFNYEYLDDTYITWEKSKSSDTTYSYSDEVNVVDNHYPYTLDMTLMKTNHPLYIMVDNKQVDLLAHPVVIQLMNYKWYSFGAVFYYLNFFIYSIYLAFFTGYILQATPPELNVIYYNGTYCDTSNIVNEKFFTYYGRYVILGLSIFMLFREIFQFYQARSGYLTFVNTFEWVTYTLTILFVIGLNKCQWDRNYIEQWQWNFGSIGIFFAWMDLVLFVQKVPRFGIYVVMITDILYTFVQFAIVFLLVIVAFAFGFYALLQSRVDRSSNKQVPFAPFVHIGKSLMKTSVMLIGEFEFTDIFHDDYLKPQFEFMTYIMFVIFLVFGSIIIMNLLVGLAVDDIKSVQIQAALKRRAMEVDLVLDVERFLPFGIHRTKILKYQKIYPNADRPISFLKYFQVKKVKAHEVEKILNPELDEIKSIQKKQKDLKRMMYELTDTVKEMRSQNRLMQSMVQAIIKSQQIAWEEEDYQDSD